jgi:hypothetical protein
MLERRKAQRRKMVLPVKVSLAGTNHLAHTVDITCEGARLGGLRTELRPGEIISLQRGSQKARFRIVWIRKLGPNEIQAGVEPLEPREDFLGVDLKAQETEKDVDPLLALLSQG